MKLWLLSQDVNGGYDTFDSCVVAAETEEAARLIHPLGDIKWDGKAWGSSGGYSSIFSEWAPPDKVEVQLIGEAAEGVEGVICSSFNAG